MPETVDVRVARIEEKIDSMKTLLEQATSPEGLTRCALHAVHMTSLDADIRSLKKRSVYTFAGIVAVMLLIGPEKLPALASLITKII